MSDDFLIHSDFSLRQLNTFGIDAKALRYVSINSVDDLQKTVKTAEFADLPYFILGGGSNILVTRDFPGLVLHVGMRGRELIGEDADSVVVRAAAGETWHELVLWTLRSGWAGLENLSLIPGSVGAAPIQNIGAYGAEVKDFLHDVTIFDLESGEIRSLDKNECRFGYRDSIFKHELAGRAVVLDVSFALPKDWRPNLEYAELAKEIQARGLVNPDAQEISNAVVAIRTRKLPDPGVIGNAGSFFKNPIVSAAIRDRILAGFPQLVSYLQPDGSYKLAAGWLIDQCGWKGKSMGAAGVYEKQALVLINRGGAKGEEIAALAKAIQEDVRTRFGVALEPEPIFL